MAPCRLRQVPKMYIKWLGGLPGLVSGSCPVPQPILRTLSARFTMLGLPALFALGAAASTITPFGPRVVYTPPITYGYPGIQNPRTLQLRDGTLLATWENYAPEPPAAYFPIFRSRDGGYSWHHLSNVTDVYGWGLRYQPALYELPVDFAGYSNGTLLLAGNSIPVSQNSTQLVLYASEDQGLTWKFLSQIESGGQPEEDSRGLSSVTDPFIL